MTCGQGTQRLVVILAISLLGTSPRVSFLQRIPEAKSQIGTSSSHQTAYSSANEYLDQLPDLFRQTLEADERIFLGQTGPVKTFFGGTDYYSQVWLRDYQTFIPAIRYYYPLEYMTSGLVCMRNTPT